MECVIFRMWEHSGFVLHSSLHSSDLVVQFTSHSATRCRTCCEKNSISSIVEQNIVSELQRWSRLLSTNVLATVYLHKADVSTVWMTQVFSHHRRNTLTLEGLMQACSSVHTYRTTKRAGGSSSCWTRPSKSSSCLLLLPLKTGGTLSHQLQFP